MSGGHRSRSVLLCIAAVFVFSASLAGASGSTRSRSIGKADSDRLRTHVEYLASDELGGRLVGTDGITQAEEYIAGQFDDLGLESMLGADGRFQNFVLHRTVFSADESLLVVADTGFSGSPGVNFRAFRYSAAGRVTAPAVFAGFGITAPYADYDDYQGLDVKGKIAIVLRGEPDTSDPASPFFGESETNHATFWAKSENAFSHGAVGVIIINENGRPERRESFLVSPSYSVLMPNGRPVPNSAPRLGEGFLVAFASRAVVDGIAAAWTLTGLQAELRIEEGTTPAELELPQVTIELALGAADESGSVPVRNVVGVLHGTIRDEYVVLGAHHDHMGSFPGAGDTIFNGADDNASGVAALLEAARLLSGVELKRSVVFVTFTAEEHGNYGAIMTLADGLFDPGSMTAMLNLDMVGRRKSEPLELFRSDPAPRGTPSVASIAADIGIAVHLETDHPPPSDQMVFLRSGVSALNFFSGYHDDYHGVDDEADRLEYDRLAQVAELAARLVAGYANSR